jgi:hypothetical protein
VAADLSARRAYVIHRGDLQRAMLMDNSKKVVYVKYRKLGPFFLSYRIVLSDFEKAEKQELLGSDHTSLWAYPPWVQESNDGGYVGIVANANELDRKEGYVAIADAAGAILGRYEYPVLEGTSMYPVGWDYESRFYFGKYADKPSERRTFWHVRPDDVVPQRVSFLDAVLTRNFSPDGKWMTYYRPTDNRLLAEGWLYNVVKKSAQLASGQTSSFQWSHDSRFIAFAEHEEEPTEVEPDEPAAIESPSLLIIYEPKSGERFSVSPHRKSDIYVYSWSLSDRYLLVGIAELYSKDGEIIPQQKRHEMPYVFSLETKEFIPVKPPHEAFRFPVRWIAGDRLLWGANIRMLVSDWDGSNPEEILRYERGRLYAFGKEQS